MPHWPTVLTMPCGWGKAAQVKQLSQPPAPAMPTHKRQLLCSPCKQPLVSACRLEPQCAVQITSAAARWGRTDKRRGAASAQGQQASSHRQCSQHAACWQQSSAVVEQCTAALYAVPHYMQYCSTMCSTAHLQYSISSRPRGPDRHTPYRLITLACRSWCSRSASCGHWAQAACV